MDDDTDRLTEPTARKQRGRPFPKGRSGNPAGRPKGSLGCTAKVVLDLLGSQVEALTQVCIQKALDGDSTALRICLDRLAPPMKDRPIQFPLAESHTPEEVADSLAKVVAGVGAGSLTPSEGTALAGLLELQRRGIELILIEERLTRLEEVMDKRRGEQS